MKIPASTPPRSVARLCGIIVIAIGAAVLVGWAFDVETLKSIFPGLGTMKPEAAAAMLLCGAMLAVLSGKTVTKPLRFGVAGLASLVILLGALSLNERLVGWRFGFDRWVSRDAIGGVQLPDPGMMSPATAFLFLLTGSALLVALQTAMTKLRLVSLSALGSAIIAIGGLAFTGGLGGTILDTHFWNHTGIAVQSLAGFGLLGFGLLALARTTGGLTWSMDRLTATWFSIGILSLAAAAAVAYNFTGQLVQAAAWVSHTQEVLKGVHKVTGDVASLGTSQRHYINTGDELFSRFYRQIGAELKPDLGNLRHLTLDNPDQQRRLDQLDLLIGRQVDSGESTIAIRRQQGLFAAERVMVNGTDTVLSDHVRDVLKEMENEEFALFDQRQKKVIGVSTTTFFLLPLGTFFSLTVLSLGLLFLNAGIGERRKAEEMLETSLKEVRDLAAIVESSNDAIVGKDLQGMVTSWNAGAERVFGYRAQEMVGQPIARLIPSDRQAEETEILSRIRRGESVPHFDTVRLRKDGSTIDISVTVSPIRDSAGTVSGASKVAREITERKRADEKIRQLNNELEQRVTERTSQLEAANKELEAFSYSVSHDLRAPLRAVGGFSQAVLEDFGPQLPEEGRRQLQTIHAGAQRMGELIDDLLRFSQLGRQPLGRQTVDPGSIVRGALADLNPLGDGRRVEISIGDLPPCEGDPALLRQVWINLLSNALKYSRNRDPAVIEVGSKREPGGTVYFVRDNGAGFDPQYAGKLFGVFQRLHRAEDYEGTGVGLAIVQQIVQRHGGRIWAEAAVDRGATFYFTLDGGTKS